MNEQKDSRATALQEMLARVQKESTEDEYIYGVTTSSGRGFFQRINDFLIEKSSVPKKEKAYFFELLATMLRAGIPLNRSLSILKSRTESVKLKRIVATIAYEIERGRQLSHALDRFPEVFNDSERGVIRSAEAVGHLEPMLAKLASTLERQGELQGRFLGALIYPAAVVVSLIAGVSVMLVMVVPRIQNIFEESAVALPLATRVLIGASAIIIHGWWAILLLFIFAVIAFHVYTTSEQGRFSWDFHLLRFPFVGELLRKIYVMRFVDTLGLLIESGLPITKSLELVAGTMTNEIYRLKTFEALGQVQQGEKLSGVLTGTPFLFPETVSNMLAVGEYSASLGEISQKIGSYFDREIEYTLKTFSTVLGPVLILVIGLMVAFFALAVLSPIFSLAQIVQ